jgi:lysozyme
MDLGKLQDLLIKHEGMKAHAYKDSRGILTIGVGHNLEAKPIPYDYSKGLTDSQIRSILSDDLTTTVNFLNSHLPWFVNLDDVRQRALADMTFNLMSKVLGFKKMLAALQAKDWNEASNQLLNSDFATQTGVRARDLASMFRTGNDA